MIQLVRGIPKTDRHKVWERFVKSGTPSQSLDASIGASWTRCRETGVDPRGYNTSNVLPPQEIQRILARNSQLIKASRAGINLLEKPLGNMPHGVGLFDAECHILYQSSTDFLAKIHEKVGFLEGGTCSEKAIGTTAPALVTADQKPVTVLREEHYSELYHWCCCAAAPIFDLHGHFVGSIAISTSYDYAEHMQFIMGLTLTMAKCIQSELHLMQGMAGFEQSRDMMDSLVNHVDSGVMVFDSAGIVLHANQKASGLLKTPTPRLISRHYSQFLKSDAIPLCLSTDRPTSGSAILAKATGDASRFGLKAEALHDRSDQLIGAIAIFEEHKKHWPVQQGRPYNTLYTVNDIVGDSQGITRAIELTRRFAASDAPILLYGETGTGKELFAQAIHNLGNRRNKPFVPVNCAAIPSGLVESELFGYRKGAFTGAAREGKKGMFELADGGTLFLDEINSMPMDLQGKLLRAIESNEIVPLGDQFSRKVDVRIISAIGCNPEQNLSVGDLRKDLFYRLSTLRIPLPPLRERTDDIETLAYAFLKQSAQNCSKSVNLIHPSAMAALRSHDWPGNIREFKSAIELAVLLTDSQVIHPEHLPDYLGRYFAGEQAEIEPSQILGETESRLIQKVLQENGGCKTDAARKMGVSRTTFYRKCYKYNLVTHRGEDKKRRSKEKS